MKKYPPGTVLEQKSDITDSCSQMILQLHDVYDPNKVSSSSLGFGLVCKRFMQYEF